MSARKLALFFGLAVGLSAAAPVGCCCIIPIPVGSELASAQEARHEPERAGASAGRGAELDGEITAGAYAP